VVPGRLRMPLAADCPLLAGRVVAAA
jgi:hypothetical protein